MLAGLLALALSVTVASPAAARKPEQGPSTPSPGHVEIQPTEQELAAQRATRRAKQEVQTAADAVSRARASLRQAALEAGDALEASAVATRRLELAEQEDVRQRDLLTGARMELAGQRAQLGRWAREAYRDGGTVGANLTVLTLLGSGSGTDIGGALTWLERVGRDKSRAVQAVQAAEAAQASATGRSQAAASAAAQAAVDAAAARGRAQAAMARQRAELGRLENALALSTRRQDAAVNRQRAIAAQTRGAGDNRVTGAVGDCRGGAVEQYPNGQIPLEALCPLALAPAHRLRADAAHAFDRLGRAYLARFGTPPCVTDSYRTYEQQVRLFALKPGLAAVPGNSNHGWGTALDMCGGIQGFGTEQYAWMLDTAPLYGWFHPAWAQAGGTRPEPWHWEFAG